MKVVAQNLSVVLNLLPCCSSRARALIFSFGFDQANCMVVCFFSCVAIDRIRCAY